jgi:hypothetical protein
MTPAHRHFLLVEEGIGSGVVNFAINGAIAWAMFREVPVVPLWGQQSIAGDTIGTTFFLPFFTCLIVTVLARRRVEAGKLAPLQWGPRSRPLLGWMPRSTLRRAAALGLATAVMIAPPTILVLAGLGVTDLSFVRFLVFKATFAAALAVLVTPIIALGAIARPSPESAQ